MFAMINLALVLAAALATGATPAPVASVNAAAPAPTVKAKTASNPDKVVCKSIAVTGTRFPTKECHTQGDWDQLAADSQKLTADSQRGFSTNH